MAGVVGLVGGAVGSGSKARGSNPSYPTAMRVSFKCLDLGFGLCYVCFNNLYCYISKKKLTLYF